VLNTSFLAIFIPDDTVKIEQWKTALSESIKAVKFVNNVEDSQIQIRVVTPTTNRATDPAIIQLVEPVMKKYNSPSKYT
jgi:hypothetical protein